MMQKSICAPSSALERVSLDASPGLRRSERLGSENYPPAKCRIFKKTRKNRELTMLVGDDDDLHDHTNRCFLGDSDRQSHIDLSERNTVKSTNLEIVLGTYDGYAGFKELTRPNVDSLPAVITEPVYPERRTERVVAYSNSFGTVYSNTMSMEQPVGKIIAESLWLYKASQESAQNICLAESIEEPPNLSDANQEIKSESFPDIDNKDLDWLGEWVDFARWNDEGANLVR